jgi:peptidoglycan/LPS O-acetylase OafA/YrhL
MRPSSTEATLALVPVLVGCELWNRKARLRKVSQRKTAFLLFWAGELTYPVYLVHTPILISVQAGMPHQTYVQKWAIATVLVILGARILHMTVEEAVLKWRRRTHRATEAEKSTTAGIGAEVDRPNQGNRRMASPTVVDSLNPVANGIPSPSPIR